MTNSRSWTGARICLALLFIVFVGSIVSGCGGGGSDPVTPQQEKPDYRLLVLLDQDILYGGKAVEEVEIEQGILRRFWVRLESRRGSDPWTVVTQAVKLDVTPEGGESGDQLPGIGLNGGMSWILAGQSKIEFQPPIGGHLGTAKLILTVAGMANAHLWVTVIPPSGGGPSPTCRDLHPTRESIGGYWWDCINGTWQNTGEPVDQPPTCRDLHPTKEIINGYWWDCIDGVWSNTGEVAYQTGELHAYGAQGEFRDGTGLVSLEQANGYRMEWYLDDSKLSGNDIAFESDILPSWCWYGTTSEIVTILWAEPQDPDLEDPGNMIVIPGNYPVRFGYCGHNYCDGTINVLHREGFSLKGLRTKPHPNYPCILITY